MKGQMSKWSGKPPLTVEFTVEEAETLAEILDQSIHLGDNPVAALLYGILMEYNEGKLA